MPKRTNKQRARKASVALKPYFDQGDIASPVVDLLTDIRHYCDTKKMDYADCDRIAYQHYLVEIGEERESK